MVSGDFRRLLGDPALIYGPALHGLLSSLRLGSPETKVTCPDCLAGTAIRIPVLSALFGETPVGAVTACPACEPDVGEAFRKLLAKLR